MTLTKAKPIGEVYDAVADYELVVVPDAPLGRALNRRLDHPQFGTFAATPRELGGGQLGRSEHRRAFLHVIDETDLGWKQAAYTIDTIFGCWEYDGSLEAILEYDQYVNSVTETVFEELRAVDTTLHRLSEYSISTSSVAVVGSELYTPLEESIFPNDYDTVSLFSDTDFQLPEVHLFDSATGIVQAVVDAITEANAENVAILLDGSSRYSSLIESALEAGNIPFYGGPGFLDQTLHRTFLQLLRASVRVANIRVATLRPLFEPLGIDIPQAHDGKRLNEIDTSEANNLQSLLETISSESFGEAVVTYENAVGETCLGFKTELNRLGMDEESITAEKIEQLTFYLQTYEVPVQRDDEGVLLADVRGSTYVDRPTVICLGIDEGWTQHPPNRPWISEADMYDQYIQEFQLQLQNGVDHHYLVEDTQGGEPVTPCLYFNELLDSEVERFSDFEHITHRQPADIHSKGFDKTDISIQPETVQTISQSSLNSYINSPRDYFFSQLLEEPERDYFTEGTIYHDFAELCANHPERIDEAVLNDVVEIMVDETRAFYREETLPIKRTKYRLGLEIIQAYLKANQPTAEEVSLESNSTKYGNALADHFGWELPKEITEHRFSSTDLGVNGVIDLIQSLDRIVDYKSGSKKTSGSIVSNASFDPPAEKPDYQALLYLAYFQQLNPNAKLEFTFVHFLEVINDALSGDFDLGQTETTVSYYPEPFDEFVHSESTFEYLRDEGSNKCQKTLSQTTYAVYDEILAFNEIPDTRDSDEFIESPLGKAMESRLKEVVGDYKYVTQGTKQLFRELARIRGRNFFADDIDAFEDFVATQLAELNRRLAGEERFPIDGPAGEPAYRRVNHRDLLINNA